MIQLTKLAKPQVLVNNGGSWTETLMRCKNNGEEVPSSVKGKYRHAEIKEQVKQETKEKCAYCESQITHQYPGDVEHIIPKAVFPRLTFTWANLSLVCYWCNNNKSDYVDKNCKLLNPYIDKISDHLRFFGPLFMHINKSKRGEITWKEIGLNRRELIDKRSDKIKELQNLIDKYERETVCGLKLILRKEIIEFSQSDKEYSYTCLCYLQDAGII